MHFSYHCHHKRLDFVFKNQNLGFESGFESLSIQIEECESALILIFLPHYLANCEKKSLCIISMYLAIKAFNFDQKSEKISHLGFKMCIKAPKY